MTDWTDKQNTRHFSGVAKCLLERGADPNVVNKKEQALLFDAAERGHKAMDSPQR
jgi:hypothetical protein